MRIDLFYEDDHNNIIAGKGNVITININSEFDPNQEDGVRYVGWYGCLQCVVDGRLDNVINELVSIYDDECTVANWIWVPNSTEDVYCGGRLLLICK